MKRRKGFYSISVVAKMFSVHQQTIRMYEKEGLISPKRTEGNTRLFSEEDVDRLEEVIFLTHKMGVNLAGVQMILKLEKKIKHMQGEMNKLFAQMQGQLEVESEKYKEDIKEQGEKLIAMKKDSSRKGAIDITENMKDPKSSSEEKDDWEIDYDEN
jgi:MerR family transcriptional regulator/heat shock protein HspR